MAHRHGEQDGDRTVERKLKEIIQSIRLTQEYEGEEGKRQIITAYLNQIYYGNQSYGVKAAAKSYFGVDDLDELTPAQAAILAALPKSPSNYDLVRNATEECLEPGEAEGGTVTVKDGDPAKVELVPGAVDVFRGRASGGWTTDVSPPVTGVRYGVRVS